MGTAMNLYGSVKCHVWALTEKSMNVIFGDRNPKAICQELLDETGSPVEVIVPTTKLPT